jgi:hypothetical protein
MSTPTSVVGDIGTIIKVDTGEALAAASTTQIKITKPSGTILTKTGIVTETTKLYYVTIAGDLDEAGIYVIQPYIVFADWSGHGLSAKLLVQAVGV